MSSARPRSPATFRPKQVEWVAQAACVHFGLPETALFGIRRSATEARARLITMAIVRDLFPYISFPEIGRAFGRDHTTVMNACKRTRQMVETSERWRLDWESVRERALRNTPEEWRPEQ